jgi:hypothetical protein
VSELINRIEILACKREVDLRTWYGEKSMHDSLELRGRLEEVRHFKDAVLGLLRSDKERLLLLLQEQQRRRREAPDD